jgi:hypothetical protein
MSLTVPSTIPKTLVLSAWLEHPGLAAAVHGCPTQCVR